MKRKSLSLILSIVLALFASPCFSESVSIFGPKTFSKEKGAPVTYTENFVVLPGTTDIQLLIKNGTDDAGAVKNVSISLNNVEVVSSADLKATGETAVDVTFLPENKLTVTLKGQGGNAVTAELIGQRMTIPTPTQPLPPFSN